MAIIRRLLWLDDQADFVQSVQPLIADLASEIRHCLDADDGFKAFEAWQPDAVLVDLKMPPGVWGGLLFLERVGVPNVPVIAVSGAGSVTQCLQAMRLGATSYVEKESVATALRGEIEKACLEHAERRTSNDYNRCKRLELTVHRIVLAALRRQAEAKGLDDIFVHLVPRKVALKTYERRLDKRGGAQEEYLDLIDLREIIDENPEVEAFSVLDRVVSRGNRRERAKWLVQLNEIRQVLMHPVRAAEITPQQRAALGEIEAIVSRWQQFLG
jgi:FixJ family two-component response regulator